MRAISQHNVRSQYNDVVVNGMCATHIQKGKEKKTHSSFSTSIEASGTYLCAPNPQYSEFINVLVYAPVQCIQIGR